MKKTEGKKKSANEKEKEAKQSILNNLDKRSVYFDELRYTFLERQWHSLIITTHERECETPFHIVINTRGHSP